MYIVGLQSFDFLVTDSNLEIVHELDINGETFAFVVIKSYAHNCTCI